MCASSPERVAAPGKHQHDHYSGDVHDAQCFSAGFGNAFDVLPPKVESHGKGEKRGRKISRQSNVQVGVTEEVVQESGKVLASGDPADGPGQNVVKHQGRDGDFGEPATHGFFNDAVNAAAYK